VLLCTRARVTQTPFSVSSPVRSGGGAGNVMFAPRSTDHLGSQERMMPAKLDYHWHLRTVMADCAMFQTTDLIGPLEQQGSSCPRVRFTGSSSNAPNA
jgi:hypothetical protein